MDNPLTPKKIQRLIHLAEDKSFNMERRMLLTEEDVKLINSHAANSRSPKCESSSGILDLDHVEGFGESGIENLSLSKSTAFNPGEMTGRSTGADDGPSGLAPPRSEEYRRRSLALDTFTSKLDKQTAEVKDIMRHSIASNYSFHSKRDLSADEVSLINREAPLPVQQSAITQFPDSISMNNSNLSVGAYFKTRCPDFGRLLEKTDSPDRSMMPSITEVSATSPYGKESNQIYKVDDSLDCVPVKQPRITGNINKLTINLPKSTVLVEKQSQVSSKTEPKVQRVEPSVSKIATKQMLYNKSQNPGTSFSAHKSFMKTSKPTDVLLKNLHTSFRLISDDTEGSGENSLSISKIADYLGKQSNVSVSDMLKLQPNKPNKKPLTELHMNTQEKQDQLSVTYLRDSKNTETASSAGTVNTVIESLEKVKINDNVPEVIVTNATQAELATEIDTKSRRARSKSPSSRSPSTASTVRDNYYDNYNSFKSADSPLHPQGEGNRSKVPSPNIEYKELDKSVDWRDVLQQKVLRQRLAKEKWAEIIASPVNGYVGVSCAVTIKVTTLTDSWLTAKFQFDSLPNDGKDLNIDLPRLPLLLSPDKSEEFTFHITSNVELSTSLPFTIILKDTSIDGDIAQKGNLEVNFKLPVVQAMSADGLNKVSYPPINEKTSLSKSFVLISDCPADLQLELSITEGDSWFQIKIVQEIKKSDVNKVLLERQGTDAQSTKSKGKGMNKQLCRLSNGNAIRVVIAFNAPKLSDLQLTEPKATFNGVLNVNLIGLNNILRKVDLVGVVGSASLQINVPNNKLHICNAQTDLSVTNTGSISGVWRINYTSSGNEFPFKISVQKFEISAGATKTLALSYSGSEDNLCDATLIFEDIATGKQTTLEITGGQDKPKSFPIKTNHNTLSWVRAGRKELSLKNSTDSKLHMRCQITGEGFSIDLPGAESRGVYCIQFSERECRPLPIVFTPNSCMPYHANLYLAMDKNSDFRRKIKLFGCANGDSVRWTGLVTYSDTALVRAVTRAPIDLKLYNKSTMPAFIAARVKFNLQYMSLESSARMLGANRVVAGRAVHTVSLRVDWARIERRAHESPTTTLATITVLTGAELTRRRILKILKDDTDELDISLLPDHLKILTGPFEGEDASMDNFFTEFEENKASLNELISGLQELTAHIDLPQDFADENTILISDDTVMDHHTICD